MTLEDTFGPVIHSYTRGPGDDAAPVMTIGFPRVF